MFLWPIRSPPTRLNGDKRKPQAPTLAKPFVPAEGTCPDVAAETPSDHVVGQPCLTFFG